jgi:hypothetical protein
LKRLTPLDVAVLGLTLLAIALIFVVARLSESAATLSAVSFAVTYCVLLLVWMVRGGWTSPLWSWLPPFFPWGLIAKSKGLRWAVVVALVAGTTVGLVATLLGGGAGGSSAV